MARTIVIGDIHGAHAALMQVLERSDFDYERDRMICLGDVADRRGGVRQCVEELLKIRNLVMILGNHDRWALEWFEGQKEPGIWLEQGGSDTVGSYGDGVPEAHIRLLREAKLYHVEGNRLFVHGGIDSSRPVDEQDPESFLWDRTLVEEVIRDPSGKVTEYDEIFVGHTPTINLASKNLLRATGNMRTDVPLKFANVWMMDTGAGWNGGRLSMMDVETKEVWQSERQG